LRHEPVFTRQPESVPEIRDYDKSAMLPRQANAAGAAAAHFPPARPWCPRAWFSAAEWARCAAGKAALRLTARLGWLLPARPKFPGQYPRLPRYFRDLRREARCMGGICTHVMRQYDSRCTSANHVYAGASTSTSCPIAAPSLPSCCAKASGRANASASEPLPTFRP